MQRFRTTWLALVLIVAQTSALACRGHYRELATAPSRVSGPLDQIALVGVRAEATGRSTAFPAYRENTTITALLGIVPLVWSQELLDERPRCLFALYEVASGRRVWESVGAMSVPARSGGRAYGREVVDPRALTFVVGAFLMTGNLESALERVVAKTSDEK